MNRYPVWKYAIIVIVLLLGLIYALPNFFGEAPAVQVSSAKSTVKVDASTQARVEQALKAANLTPDLLTLDASSVRARFATPDEAGRMLLMRAGEAGGLTARGWTRTVRLARTIADLDGSTGVLRRHIAEALIYRRATVGAQADFDRRTAHRGDVSFGLREDDGGATFLAS